MRILFILLSVYIFLITSAYSETSPISEWLTQNVVFSASSSSITSIDTSCPDPERKIFDRFTVASIVYTGKLQLLLSNGTLTSLTTNFTMPDTLKQSAAVSVFRHLSAYDQKSSSSASGLSIPEWTLNFYSRFGRTPLIITSVDVLSFLPFSSESSALFATIVGYSSGSDVTVFYGGRGRDKTFTSQRLVYGSFIGLISLHPLFNLIAIQPLPEPSVFLPAADQSLFNLPLVPISDTSPATRQISSLHRPSSTIVVAELLRDSRSNRCAISASLLRLNLPHNATRYSFSYGFQTESVLFVTFRSSHAKESAVGQGDDQFNFCPLSVGGILLQGVSSPSQIVLSVNLELRSDDQHLLDGSILISDHFHSAETRKFSEIPISTLTASTLNRTVFSFPVESVSLSYGFLALWDLKKKRLVSVISDEEFFRKDGVDSESSPASFDLHYPPSTHFGMITTRENSHQIWLTRSRTNSTVSQIGSSCLNLTQLTDTQQLLKQLSYVSCFSSQTLQLSSNTSLYENNGKLPFTMINVTASILDQAGDLFIAGSARGPILYSSSSTTPINGEPQLFFSKISGADGSYLLDTTLTLSDYQSLIIGSNLDSQTAEESAITAFHLSGDGSILFGSSIAAKSSHSEISQISTISILSPCPLAIDFSLESCSCHLSSGSFCQVEIPHGVCSCVSQFILSSNMDTCLPESCPNSCSPHGKCTDDGCICDPTWTGRTCDIQFASMIETTLDSINNEESIDSDDELALQKIHWRSEKLNLAQFFPTSEAGTFGISSVTEVVLLNWILVSGSFVELNGTAQIGFILAYSISPEVSDSPLWIRQFRLLSNENQTVTFSAVGIEKMRFDMEHGVVLFSGYLSTKLPLDQSPVQSQLPEVLVSYETRLSGTQQLTRMKTEHWPQKLNLTTKGSAFPLLGELNLNGSLNWLQAIEHCQISTTQNCSWIVDKFPIEFDFTEKVVCITAVALSSPFPNSFRDNINLLTFSRVSGCTCPQQKVESIYPLQETVDRFDPDGCGCLLPIWNGTIAASTHQTLTSYPTAIMILNDSFVLIGGLFRSPSITFYSKFSPTSPVTISGDSGSSEMFSVVYSIQTGKITGIPFVLNHTYNRHISSFISGFQRSQKQPESIVWASFTSSEYVSNRNLTVAVGLIAFDISNATLKYRGNVSLSIIFPFSGLNSSVANFPLPFDPQTKRLNVLPTIDIDETEQTVIFSGWFNQVVSLNSTSLAPALKANGPTAKVLFLALGFDAVHLLGGADQQRQISNHDFQLIWSGQLSPPFDLQCANNFTIHKLPLSGRWMIFGDNATEMIFLIPKLCENVPASIQRLQSQKRVKDLGACNNRGSCSIFQSGQGQCRCHNQFESVDGPSCELSSSLSLSEFDHELCLLRGGENGTQFKLIDISFENVTGITIVVGSASASISITTTNDGDDDIDRSRSENYNNFRLNLENDGLLLGFGSERQSSTYSWPDGRSLSNCNISFICSVEGRDTVSGQSTGVRVTSAISEHKTSTVFVAGWANPGQLTVRHSNGSVFSVANSLNNGSPWAGQVLLPEGIWLWFELVDLYNRCRINCPKQQLAEEQQHIVITTHNKRSGVDLFVGGIFFSQFFQFDGFVRRYELYLKDNGQHESFRIWDTIFTTQKNGMKNFRGVRSLACKPNGDVIAAGYWSPPNLKIVAQNLKTNLLSQDLNADESIILRWAAALTYDRGSTMWVSNSDPPINRLFSESDCWDLSLGRAEKTVCLTVNQPEWISQNTSFPTRDSLLLDSSGIVMLSLLDGQEYSAESTANVMTSSSNGQTSIAISSQDVHFLGHELDVNDNSFVIGSRNRSVFLSPSATMFPSLFLHNVIGSNGGSSRLASLISWDRIAQPRFVLQTISGNSELRAISSDYYGRLFLIGYTNTPTFFNNTLELSPGSSFIVNKLTACRNLCQGHGECVFPTSAFMATNVLHLYPRCSCHPGWEGDFCDQPICPLDQTTRMQCSGRGKCVNPALCECIAGWGPPDCSNCADGFQPPQCLNCLPGFKSPECNKCIDNFSPPFCDSCLSGFLPPTCSTCIKNFKLPNCTTCIQGFKMPDCIECEEHYQGANCLSTCADHNRRPPECVACLESKQSPNCSCPTGFQGSECSEPSCFPLNNCNATNGNGLCISSLTCFCVNGWSGSDCSSPPDYSQLRPIIEPQQHLIITHPGNTFFLDGSSSFAPEMHSPAIDLSWSCVNSEYPLQPCDLSNLNLVVSQNSSSPQLVLDSSILAINTNHFFKLESETKSIQTPQVTASASIEISVWTNTSLPIIKRSHGRALGWDGNDERFHSLDPSQFLYYPTDKIFVNDISFIEINCTEEKIEWFDWLVIDKISKAIINTKEKREMVVSRLSSDQHNLLLLFPPFFFSDSGNSTSILLQYLFPGSAQQSRIGGQLFEFSIIQEEQRGICFPEPRSGTFFLTKVQIFCEGWMKEEVLPADQFVSYQWLIDMNDGSRLLLYPNTTEKKMQFHVPEGLRDVNVTVQVRESATGKVLSSIFTVVVLNFSECSGDDCEKKDEIVLAPAQLLSISNDDVYLELNWLVSLASQSYLLPIVAVNSPSYWTEVTDKIATRMITAAKKLNNTIGRTDFCSNNDLISTFVFIAKSLVNDTLITNFQIIERILPLISNLSNCYVPGVRIKIYPSDSDRVLFAKFIQLFSDLMEAIGSRELQTQFIDSVQSKVEEQLEKYGDYELLREQAYANPDLLYADEQDKSIDGASEDLNLARVSVLSITLQSFQNWILSSISRINLGVAFDRSCTDHAAFLAIQSNLMISFNSGDKNGLQYSFGRSLSKRVAVVELSSSHLSQVKMRLNCVPWMITAFNYFVFTPNIEGL